MAASIFIAAGDDKTMDNYRFHARHVNFINNGKQKVAFENYQTFLEDYIPEKGEELSGVPAATIRQMAKWLADSSATTPISNGVCHA